MVARATLVLFFIALAFGSDVIQEHETVDGVVPGLGKIEAEGTAGAQFEGSISTKTSNGAWEGTGELNAEWNRDLLRRRDDEMAKQKREQLKRAILLQRTALEDQQKREQAAEEKAQGTIDDPEVEVEDGYTVGFQPALPPTRVYHGEEGMIAGNPLPPPYLVKKNSFLIPQITPGHKASPPIVVVDSHHPGELIAQLENSHPDHLDIPTEMPHQSFQTWNLDRPLAVEPGSIELTSNAVSNHAGVDRVGIAHAKASGIVSEFFDGKNQLPNKEDVMDNSFAWGVMNMPPQQPIHEDPTEYQLSPSVSPSPIPSPSPSTAPREVYLQEPLIMQKETGDLSFSKMAHVENKNVMQEKYEEEEAPCSAPQPLEAVYHSFVGVLPHPDSVETAEHRNPAGLTGMGRETALQPDMYAAIDATAEATLMNRLPVVKRAHH